MMLSVWMLEGSYNVAVRPRSNIMHLSFGEETLLCGRRLLDTDYELVDEVDREDILPVMWTFACGQYGCFYQVCKACQKALPQP